MTVNPFQSDFIMNIYVYMNVCVYYTCTHTYNTMSCSMYVGMQACRYVRTYVLHCMYVSLCMQNYVTVCKKLENCR